MRIKVDFVTNSSSASFILLIESTTTDIIEFKKLWDRYLDAYINEDLYYVSDRVNKRKDSIKTASKEIHEADEKIKNKIPLVGSEKILYNFTKSLADESKLSNQELQRRILGNMDIRQVVGNVFEIASWTSMFNDILGDLPRWMKYLIILNNLEPMDVKSDFGFKNIRLKIEEDH